MDDAFTSEPSTAVSSYEPIGREALRQRNKCTQAEHDHARDHAWGSLLNSRPWPGMGLEIAECGRCWSTLARECEAA